MTTTDAFATTAASPLVSTRIQEQSRRGFHIISSVEDTSSVLLRNGREIFSGRTIKIEEVEEATSQRVMAKNKSDILSLVFSVGGILTIGLSITSLTSLVLFGVGLYKSIFITPSFALFLAFMSAGLAFEVINSRKLIKK